MPHILVAEEPGVGVTGKPRPSEDRVVLPPHAVVVLDGATTLTPGMPSGGWYATQLGEELSRGLSAEPGADLSDTLAAAIRSVASTHDLVPGSAPSSTVAIARWTEDRVDALVLADSPVVAFGSAGLRVLEDDQLRRVPRSPGGFRRRLRDGGGYDDAHLDALRTGMTATARYRNIEGGFWVAEADPAAAAHAARASWPRAETDALLIATDGVACGVDDYGIFDWPMALDHARAQGPGAVLVAVRHAEREDPDGVRWPRPKRHDDQALVLVDGL